MFRRWLRPDFDITSPYPEIGAHRAAIQARDWAGARLIHDRADWYLRHMLAVDATKLDGVETFLRDVASRDPQDPVAATMLGHRLVVLAWAARTRLAAHLVSAAQFQTFFAYLRQAEEVLGEVLARDPVNPPAWTQRLAVSRGLQLGVSETRRRYDQLSLHVPNFLPAQREVLQDMAPKWSGNLELMHGFAQECTVAAPPGAHNAALVVEANMEHHRELLLGGARRFSDPEAVSQIREAGARSVLHPDFQRTPGWVQALSSFAVGYAVIHDMSTAKALFIRLRPFGDDTPWWIDRKSYTKLYRATLALRSTADL